MAGPSLKYSEWIHKNKYRNKNETFLQMIDRLCDTLADTPSHRSSIWDILSNMRFLPGGRIQKDIGSPYATTAFNCFVSGKIEDSMSSIMDRLKEAAETLRRGGGMGYDFSNLRPRGAYIRTLNSHSSGPISFMELYNTMCGTVQSAGHRRGAQMAVLRVDHPDILDFITCKSSDGKLTNFNISVAITDDFMEALKNDEEYELRFEGRIYKKIPAKTVWDAIMKNTWDYAEPGVIFIDRMNAMNPMYYIEHIIATNPCGEIPLPEYGCCLLGSFNLTKYVEDDMFNYDLYIKDIHVVVRAMDNVIDNTEYPLDAQRDSEKAKRRMGLGITGTANAIELMGHSYGDSGYISIQNGLLETLRNEAYKASIELAKEKGSFPLLDRTKFVKSGFVSTLPDDIRDGILNFGIRNGSLLSIAPTGTISICADNISSGIEPPFALEYIRPIKEFHRTTEVKVTDWLYREHNIKGKTADTCSVQDHVRVLCAAQQYIDHAVSKTCNVGTDISFAEFKGVYTYAYEGGAKGVTTFREGGKKKGHLKKNEEGAACTLDPETGKKSCD